MPSQSLLHTSGRVLAAIDHSSFSASICDHAAWAAGRLGAPLEFVHILDRHPETAPGVDLSGALQLEQREGLLEELSSLDEKRGRLAQERGHGLLDSARARAKAAGVAPVEARMRNGTLVETLTELEPDVRLFVIGKRGQHADTAQAHLGSNLERVIRAVHRPVLVSPRGFKAPQRFLVAFDGNATTRKGVEMIAQSPLFRGLPCHLVMAGTDNTDARAKLEEARSRLAGAGFEVAAELKQGKPETVIAEAIRTHGIDLLAMGAYGHSHIRHLIVGSTTTTMLRVSEVPVLLLR